jgi:hypothetical protein
MWGPNALIHPSYGSLAPVRQTKARVDVNLFGLSIAKQRFRGALAAGRGVCYKYEAA